MFDESIKIPVPMSCIATAAHAANVRLAEMEVRLAALSKAVEAARAEQMKNPTKDWGYNGSYYAAGRALDEALGHMGIQFEGSEQ